MSKINEMRLGFETAYIDGSVVSSSTYRPQFVSNNHKEGKKVLSSIEDELLSCDGFQISVAFITMSGITPLLQTLKELEKRNIKGEILTTNYLNFSEPRALKKLDELSNITLKMYDVEMAAEGFHTKGYIFKTDEIYRIIIGSSNITSAALTSNREWNTKLISTEQGEVAKEIVAEFDELWNSKYALSFDDFYENYKERYKIIKHQREIAKQEEITSIEKYKLQPNSMQVGFITNLKRILAAGEDRALLISATGTGKTYASAFAMRELGFKRVLFLVHRGQLARQTKKSYEKVFAKSVSMGLVGAGYHEYNADYVFATVQTLNRDEHLLQYAEDTFDCIILDEAHHVPAGTYQKIMKHFTPRLWLGMTATPDKRDDNVEGRNVYEIFNYQIAYEIRLQQAMEENLLCPFHYFGITDLSIIDDEASGRDFSMLTGDERVKHIIEQADYYGYSGDKVKGLIFCSSIRETEELSAKFNQAINPVTGQYFRTIALNGSASEQERQNAFIEKEGGDYKPTKAFLKMLANNDFWNVLGELVDFGISRYERDYKYSYDQTDLVLYQKYTYEDVCRLLNWEQNEVPLNIGGYKFDKKTKTFPVFINYDKAEDISDTTKYEDHFVPGFRDRLIAISKSGRSLQSEDVQNFLKAKERGIQVELFVRKNKDDKISKEFYYLGHMTASGTTKEFTMANTEKTAVEIEWILDVPVREM